MVLLVLAPLTYVSLMRLVSRRQLYWCWLGSFMYLFVCLFVCFFKASLFETLFFFLLFVFVSWQAIDDVGKSQLG